MTARRCTLCETAGLEVHHVVGRGLDSRFTCPVCHDHHELVNADDWNIAGAPDDWVPPTRLHALAVGLDRAAMFVGRAADAPMLKVVEPLLRPLAVWLADCALELTRILALFDARLPGYRQILGQA